MGKKVGTSGEKQWETGTQSGEQGLDPQTQAWLKSIYEAAQRAGGAPPPSGVTDASGGSRHGVASGVAMGEAARNQNAQIAGLLNTGFEGAMGRAGQLAGLGYGAAGAGANLGMTAGNPDLWRMEIMRRGFQGLPYGTTSRGTGGRTGAKLGYTGEASAKIPFLG